MDLLLQQLYNGVLIGSTYALVALGFTLVLGTLDLLNFAHGETIMLSAYAGLRIVNISTREQRSPPLRGPRPPSP